LAENSFFARQPDGSRIVERAAYYRVVRQLAEEPMELMALDSMPEWLRRLMQNSPL
jgi:hypothetical protein